MLKVWDKIANQMETNLQTGILEQFVYNSFDRRDTYYEVVHDLFQASLHDLNQDGKISKQEYEELKEEEIEELMKDGKLVTALTKTNFLPLFREVAQDSKWRYDDFIEYVMAY